MPTGTNSYQLEAYTVGYIGAHYYTNIAFARNTSNKVPILIKYVL